LAGTPEQAAPKIERDISESIGRLGGGLLGDPSGLVSGAFSLAVDLFGIIFVAAYLLADSRRVKVAYLTATPRRNRHDARAVELLQARLLARHERALPGPLHPGSRFRTGSLPTRRPLRSGAGRLGVACGPVPRHRERAGGSSRSDSGVHRLASDGSPDERRILHPSTNELTGRNADKRKTGRVLSCLQAKSEGCSVLKC
jgi:hypothetical protein